jgi:uncharacterized protein
VNLFGWTTRIRSQACWNRWEGGGRGGIAEGHRNGRLIPAQQEVAKDSAQRNLGLDGQVAEETDVHSRFQTITLISSASIFRDMQPRAPAIVDIATGGPAMAASLRASFVIPARAARAFVVERGQVLRIEMIEGKQVGDCAFFNADDRREVFHVGQSWALNVAAKTGTAKSFKHFYSKPPRENVMLTVVEDTVKNHWGNMGGRCSRRWHEITAGDPDHPSCQENLTQALRPFGLTGDDIIDVFNVFMNVELSPDGGFTLKPPSGDKGSYIDLRAEMNILAAISACPGDRSPTNDFKPKALGVKIFG